MTEEAMLGLVLPGMSVLVLPQSKMTRFTSTQDVELYPLLLEIPPSARDAYMAVRPECDLRRVRTRM